MHEMSYVVRFVNLAIETASEQKADKVRSITVSVGEMTDVLPEYLQKYYPETIRNTILEGSELKVNMVPALVECAGCKNNYTPTRENKYLCPHCGDGNGRVIAGRDVVLESVEVI